jgi:hypothetical protein
MSVTPDQPLHYHFSSDVLASALQTLSFDVLHSSYALSLAHDVMFGPTVFTLALLLDTSGSAAAIVVGAAAPAL